MGLGNETGDGFPEASSTKGIADCLNIIMTKGILNSSTNATMQIITQLAIK